MSPSPVLASRDVMPVFPRTLRQIVGLPNTQQLPAAHTALLLIDFQNEYFTGGALPLPQAEAAAHHASRLLQHARTHGWQVLHIRHAQAAPIAPLFAKDSHGAAIYAGLQALPTEAVLDKTFPSAFVATDLHVRLKKAQTRNLVLAGLMPHNCILATACDGLLYGYHTLVAADACGTRPLPDWQGHTVSATVLHQAVMAGLGDRIAEVLSTADLLALPTGSTLL